MTIASLIVQLGANTAELEKIEKHFDNIEGAAWKLTKVLAGAFTVTAVVGAAKSVLDFADNMENLSARTGISTTGLQKLDAAFLGSGVTLDTVTSNIDKFTKNLMGGDKSAVAAMQKLGLNVDALKTMAPDQMFLKVADAVGNIQNPTEKAFAAMTIFGKGGAELIQGLTGHLTEAADGFKDFIPPEQLAAADKFGDQLEAMGKQLMFVLAGALTPMLPALSALATAFGSVAHVVGPVLGFAVKGVTLAIEGLWAGIAELLGSLADLAQRVPFVGKYLGGLSDASAWLHDSAAKTSRMIEDLALGTTASGAAAKAAVPHLIGLGDAVQAAGGAADAAGTKLAHSFKAQMEASQKYWDSVDKIEKDMHDVRLDLTDKFYKEQERIAEGAGKKILETTLQLNESLISLDAERTRNLLAVNLPGMGATNDVGKLGGESYSHSFMSAANEGLKGIGPAILGALQGGGDVIKSVASAAGLGFSQHMFGEKSPFHKMISSNFSGALGDMINSVMPGIGALIGPLVSKIAGFFGNIFGGPNSQEKAGRSASDAFTSSLASSLDWMQKIELHQLIAAGNSEKFATQLIAIRDGFAKAGHTADETNDVINRLWAAEKLGGNAVQQVIDEITMKMHDTLPAAALDMAHATIKGLDGIDEKLHTLQDTFGDTSTVAALQDQIHTMVGAGVTDFTAMSDSIDAMLKSKQAALDATIRQWQQINGDLHLSGGEGTSEGRNASDILKGLSAADAKAVWLDQIASTGSTGQDWERVKGQYGFAGGTPGLGFMDFGTGTLAMLHGREAIVPQNRAHEFRGGGSMTDEDRQEARDRHEELLGELRRQGRDFRSLPTMIKSAVILATA